MLKRLKIVYKMVLLSVTLILFTAAVGYLGYHFNRKANEDLTSMYKDRLKPIQWLNDTRSHFRANEANVLYLLLYSDDKKQQETRIADIEARVKKVEENWKNYKSTTLDPFEVKTVPEVEKNLDSYVQIRIQIIALVQEGKIEEAKRAFETSNNTLESIQEGFRSLAEYNADKAQKVDQQNDKDNTIAQVILISTIAAAIILGILLAAFITMGIIKPVSLLKKELTTLSEKGGDLTQSIRVDTKDELGELAAAVNTFLGNLRDIMAGVMAETGNVETAVEIVNENIMYLNREMEEVSATTEELSASMEETAASTEEMNATSSEIEAAIESISVKAQEGAKTAGEIKQRADVLKATAITSQKQVDSIYSSANMQLKEAIEQSKAVQQIHALTSAILSITEQTNLLALNAAIEAARAGEAGKGFAVVADEIRKLADQSKHTASEIQNVTRIVVNSVDNLSENAQGILKFIDTQVLKDYAMLVNTGERYSEDAEMVDNLVTDFSATSQQLMASMENMSKAIQEITAAANEGANGTTNIAARAMSIVEKTGEIVAKTDQTKESANRLTELVGKFKV